MRALSIIPCYAMNILEGYKTVECRSWRTDYRGTILICSSNRKQHRCICGHTLCLVDLVDVVIFEKKHLKDADMDQMPSELCYAWILENIRPVVPVPVKGKLHLWDYDGEIELIGEKKFKDEKEKDTFWKWYKSLAYFSPRRLKHEAEYPELFEEVVKNNVENSRDATNEQASSPEKVDPAIESKKYPQITPIPYICAEVSECKLSTADYVAVNNRMKIGNRALSIVQEEAPIQKDVLIRKILASFGVNRSTTVLEATEKALKAVKIKSKQQNGVVFYWAPDQDPDAYNGLRVSNERAGEEICPQELRNAVVYALQMKGDLYKGSLVKEASVALGYKRLGRNLEATLTAGVQFALSSGAIVRVTGGKYSLP